MRLWPGKISWMKERINYKSQKITINHDKRLTINNHGN